MPNAKIKDYLHLHFIVFIWGFTAVLGKLITIAALPLVWYRMLIATIIILIFVKARRFPFTLSGRNGRWMVLAGIAIALHWVTFFMAIKVATVSVALATMSTGAFFTAVLEPIWYGRKVIAYEIIFGMIVMIGLAIIFRVESQYAFGIGLALISAFLSAIFSLVNGQLVRSEKPSVISLYELGIGALFLSIYLAATGGFTTDLLRLSTNDWLFIFILSSICTAYAFIASVKVMRHLSPYTVMLTVNLEPVYGIVLAFLLLGDEEKMSPMFYLGALIILGTVVLNGILKTKDGLKK
ncbi:DMT family transporter [Flavobacteriaceae bacterium TP-CH-4]|uniref:DMT family transporter n=1 Tax=Pelagihabitans pacificus TaxID=2696054 RepID=A0A967APN5_9FLAO|nr:DMT family transporter [Pelagihabitans pacificus]NHF57712.1 DMT family transporter [Pelagihabitans pacificus]